eukprot:6208307-Pleurochrysis_carterae.AAC.3
MHEYARTCATARTDAASTRRTTVGQVASARIYGHVRERAHNGETGRSRPLLAPHNAEQPQAAFDSQSTGDRDRRRCRKRGVSREKRGANL